MVSPLKGPTPIQYWFPNCKCLTSLVGKGCLLKKINLKDRVSVRKGKTGRELYLPSTGSFPQLPQQPALRHSAARSPGNPSGFFHWVAVAILHFLPRHISRKQSRSGAPSTRTGSIRDASTTGSLAHQATVPDPQGPFFKDHSFHSPSHLQFPHCRLLFVCPAPSGSRSSLLA